MDWGLAWMTVAWLLGLNAWRLACRRADYWKERCVQRETQLCELEAQIRELAKEPK